MATRMDDDDTIQPDLVLPEIYTFTPLRALRVASRRKLSGFLDLEGALVVVNHEGGDSDVVNDYSGLAELAGFDYNSIMNMKRQKSPTFELLEKWTGQNGTVGNLWTYLFLMERFDVLVDCRRPIIKDCEKYEENLQLAEDAERYRIEQDPTVTTSEMRVDETKFATRGDVMTGKKTFYDAFICWSSEDEKDRQFLYEMINELEVKRGLKLFVPGRDDLPGSAEHTITAYLIEARCRRVVILMSRTFLQSSACDFQVKFAHALAPGARSKKLIPVIREKNTPIPRILRFLALCDFGKSDMVEWVWDRLSTAIIAPIGPNTYFEPEDEHNPFEQSDESLKAIRFPTPRRLDEHDERSVNSGAERIPTNVSNRSQLRAPTEHGMSSEVRGQPTSNYQSLSSSPTTFTDHTKKGATNKSKTATSQKPSKKDKKRESGSMFNKFKEKFV
ncbi:myeloid differentiation primary response protein MyD88-like isoform X1 [Ruditapes philippinarum]|uniref:myeloid differentiation primary response protein MyD88-like isoform X1 n=1 Tax=Ruditapes philippinarum TaxID=129788 RepID=UPI00295B98FE|nr:myeloid differentiation primary response protein MyD88-like isoform X1 [Ruditapes philippinarum]